MFYSCTSDLDWNGLIKKINHQFDFCFCGCCYYIRILMSLFLTLERPIFSLLEIWETLIIFRLKKKIWNNYFLWYLAFID